eukprot:PhF_6_TR15100/c0_g1_i1/m.23768
MEHWINQGHPRSYFHVGIKPKVPALPVETAEASDTMSLRPPSTSDRIAHWSFRKTHAVVQSESMHKQAPAGPPGRSLLSRPSSAKSNRAPSTSNVLYKRTTTVEAFESRGLSRPSSASLIGSSFASATLEAATELNELLSEGIAESNSPRQILSVYSATFGRVLDLCEKNPLVGILRRIKNAYEHEIFVGHQEKMKILHGELQQARSKIEQLEIEIDSHHRHIDGLKLEVETSKKQVTAKTELLEFVLNSKGIGYSTTTNSIKSPISHNNNHKPPSLVEMIAHHMTVSRLQDLTTNLRPTGSFESGGLKDQDISPRSPKAPSAPPATTASIVEVEIDLPELYSPSPRVEDGGPHARGSEKLSRSVNFAQVPLSSVEDSFKSPSHRFARKLDNVYVDLE